MRGAARTRSHAGERARSTTCRLERVSTERPADIARKPWQRRASDAWTTAPLRAPVLTFLDGFVAEHGWARAWDVTERFSDHGVNVRVPRRSPVQPPEREPFYQRPGLRLLVIGVTRCRDARRFEVAISLPRGNTTPASELTVLLGRARLSLEAENRRAA
jgi:hypothetical protein